MVVTDYNRLVVSDRLSCYIDQLEKINVELNLRKNTGPAGTAVANLVENFLDEISHDPNFVVDSCVPTQLFPPATTPDGCECKDPEPFLIKMKKEEPKPIFDDLNNHWTQYANNPDPDAEIGPGTKRVACTLLRPKENAEGEVVPGSVKIDRFDGCTWRKKLVGISDDGGLDICIWIYRESNNEPFPFNDLLFQLEDSTGVNPPVQGFIEVFGPPGALQNNQWYLFVPFFGFRENDNKYDTLRIGFGSQSCDKWYWDCVNLCNFFDLPLPASSAKALPLKTTNGTAIVRQRHSTDRKVVTRANVDEDGDAGSCVFGVWLVREDGSRYRVFDKLVQALNGREKCTLAQLSGKPQAELIPAGENNITYSEAVCCLKQHFCLVKSYLNCGRHC